MVVILVSFQQDKTDLKELGRNKLVNIIFDLFHPRLQHYIGAN